MPGAERPPRWAPLLPEGTGGKRRPERGAPARGTPWGRGGASPAGLAFQGPGETRRAPSPLPRRRAGGGRAGGRPGEGGRPQEAALFLEPRFKETQDARLSPTIVAAATAAPAHSWEERARTLWAKGPAPHPGLLTHPPCLCLWCLDGPFWAFPLGPAQRAPPPGSPPAPHVGQLPTQTHTTSRGSPHRSPDFLPPPPQQGLSHPARAEADPLLTGTDARGQVGPFLGGVSGRMEAQPSIWVGVRPLPASESPLGSVPRRPASLTKPWRRGFPFRGRGD